MPDQPGGHLTDEAIGNAVRDAMNSPMHYVFMEIETGIGTDNHRTYRPLMLWECQECGMSVQCVKTHDEWHKAQNG